MALSSIIITLLSSWLAVMRQALLQAARQAVQKSETLNRMGQAIQDTIGPVGDIDIPEKHAFLAERIQEFNATIPYSGFSQGFLEQMNRPGRFEKEARRRAYTTLEAIFCLLPLPKKVRLFLGGSPALRTD
jgi:hypothetical protein